MLKLILPAVILFSSCAVDVSEQIVEKQTTPETISKVKLTKKSDGSFEFPTLYWAVPRGVAEQDWNAVFGGTVIEVKKESDDPYDKESRKFVSGAIKIEKTFLNLPDTSEISINSIVRSENFDGLKKGDKVIIFINGNYEGGYVRIEIDGTNSKLGFKVKDWSEAIVTALEKVAPCSKIETTWVEGHPEDFRAKMHDCLENRNKIILDDPQVAEIWKRYDPKGFQYLVELREMDENAGNFD